MTDNIVSIKVQNPWFNHIKNKKKTIEGRLNKGTFMNLAKGQIIKILSNDDYFFVKIKNIRKYNTFYEYLVQEGLRRCLPEIKTIEDGVNIYRQFYSVEAEKEYGILAISIKKINYK